MKEPIKVHGFAQAGIVYRTACGVAAHMVAVEHAEDDSDKITCKKCRKIIAKRYLENITRLEKRLKALNKVWRQLI